MYEHVWVQIELAGGDISDIALYAQTSFTISASAQPGTCQIAIPGPLEDIDQYIGQLIVLRIDERLMWQGYVMMAEEGYFFPDYEDAPQVILHGVDLNIHLDKLVMYNHAFPTRYPDGGGTYKRVRVVEDGTTYGYIVSVPRYTNDDTYIRAMLNDFDMPSIIRWRGSDNKIDRLGMINPDGNFTPPAAGTTLRNFLTDVSANVQRSEPGYSVWYIDPEGYLVYTGQETNNAPFWVGDDDPETLYNGVYGVNVRDLRITTDISSIKNDVLIFTGTLDPRPSSSQDQLLYSHKKKQSSITQYGRFQYSEVLNSDWLQGAVNVKANKILNQEGDPGKTAEFTLFQRGPEGETLYPGQIVNVISLAHGIEENFPVRSISMSFPSQRDDGYTIVEYRVTCSYDTNDPWGLLLALKRPVTRGLVNPNFRVIDRISHPDLPIDPARVFTLVKERPRSLGNRYYQCSYGYIRDSLTVFVGRYRRVGVPEDGGTVGFLETSPGEGKFRIFPAAEGGEKVYVEYHVWKNLD